jgi:hypothetical protein
VLDLVDVALEAFVRATVPLDARDVDVSFEAPEKEWSAKLTRPTVNMFLWDIRRSSDRARAGVEERERNGVVVRRMALPVVELRYLVTAWTSDHRDERALLGGLMRAILAHSELPSEFLPEPLRAERRPTLTMARSGEDQVDIFKGVHGQLKPGIHVVVTTPVDVGLEAPVAPDAGAVDVGVADRTGTASTRRRRVAGEVADAAAIGAVVTSPHGATLVNATGRFLIDAQPGDEVVVHTDPPLVAVVGDAGGVRLP